MSKTNEIRDELDRLSISDLQERVERLTVENEALRAVVAEQKRGILELDGEADMVYDEMHKVIDIMRAEISALQAVALAADVTKTAFIEAAGESGIANWIRSHTTLYEALDAPRAAGYLPAREEVRP